MEVKRTDYCIKRAVKEDIGDIDRLLRQVLEVHHNGRPDLFKTDTKKYTDEQLEEIILDDERPIFVAKTTEGRVLGYAFCIMIWHENDNILTDIRTLYIDDLCVDEECRGMSIGRALYEYVLEYARNLSCYNVTLNVWTCNRSAMAFYEKLGLVPQKIGMEKIL